MMEEWKRVPFAPAYQASSFGRIIGVRGTLLYPTLNYANYLVCDLHRIQYRVNRIICWTFHGEPPSDTHQAAHRDNVRVNNHKDNLYWATPHENGEDLSKSGHIKGIMNCCAVLDEEDVKLIRRLREDGYSIADIHRDYFSHTSYATIQHAAIGRTWRHVDA